MGIPLPALSIRPPAPAEDPLSQFGRVVALRNMLVTAPLQQQALAQQVQAGGLQLQQQQQDFQDRQKLRQIMTDPSINWEDPNAYGTVLTKAGQAGVSPQTIMGLRGTCAGTERYSPAPARSAAPSPAGNG